MAEASPRFDAESFTRPDPILLQYYILASLVWGPLFPFALVIHLFRYKTLLYEIGPTRISASWGKLVHRKVSLSYDRVQDIQLRRNFFERKMGLARIEIQTASGEAKAEIALEGVTDYEAVRTHLWQKVREARDQRPTQADASEHSARENDPLVAALLEAAEELRAIRALLGPDGAGPAEPPAEEPAS